MRNGLRFFVFRLVVHATTYRYAAQLGDALMDEATASSWPSWQSRIAGDEPEGRGSSVMLDEMEKPNQDVDAITAEFVERLRSVAAQQLRDQQRKQNS